MMDRPAAFTKKLLDELKRLDGERKNSLYAWQAIYHCCVRGIPLPEWTQAYLATAAINLMHLMDRSGADLGLGPIPFSAQHPYRDGRDDLKPGEALDGTAWAFMLAGERGASAFSRLASDAKHNADLRTTTAATMLEGKQNPKVAREKIIRRRGLSTDGDPERSVRRRLRKAKSIAGDQE